MISRKLTRIIVSALLAVSATGWVYWLDSQRAIERDSQVALQLARQVATQATGLAFEFKTQGKKDAFTKAVELVNQGQDPRAVKIFPLRKLASQESEIYSYQSRTGTFEYMKTLSPEEGKGIRILVEMGARKFMGAVSSFQNDGGIFFVFNIFLFLSFFSFSYFILSKKNQSKNQVIQKWIIEIRSLVARLGVHIREILKGVEDLMRSVIESKKITVELHDKIHRGLSEIHGAGKKLKEAELECDRARHSLVELWSEVKNLEGHYPEVYEKIKNLAKNIEKMKKLTRESANGCYALEVQVEPWAQEADFALQAFDRLTQATDGVSIHLKNTTSTLLGQAKQIQKMNSEFESDQLFKASSKK